MLIINIKVIGASQSFHSVVYLQFFNNMEKKSNLSFGGKAKKVSPFDLGYFYGSFPTASLGSSETLNV